MKTTAYILALGLAAFGFSQTAMAAPDRVVSANMCADRLLLDLAAPNQIAALSPYASDPSTAIDVDRAKNYAKVGSGSEEIMRFSPDLVVVGSFNTAVTTAMLRQLGVDIFVVQTANNFTEVRQIIQDLANALGRPQSGADLVAKFDQELKSLPKAQRPIRAAILQAGGYTSGTGTMTDQILQAIGVTNLAAEIGIQGFGSMSLETLAQHDPDILIVENMGTGMASMADEFLRHPVLLRSRAKIINLPMKLWACPDLALVDAAKLILGEAQ